jgi:hypothetical protein
MDNFKKNIYRTSDTTSVLDSLAINSSAPISGIGTLNFTGGQPGETLNLSFSVTADINFNSLNFGAPVTVLDMDPIHLARTGTVVLNGSGAASSTYTWDTPTTVSSCIVTITARSSIYPIPVPNNTHINN